MYDRVRLDWRVPTAEWQQFRDYVQDEFGSLGGYLGREAEAAMREYANADDYNALEQKVDQLVQAAGRTPEESFKQKKSSFDGDTTRVTVKIEASVKDDFRKTVDDSEDTYGEAFARALSTYRDGGRAGRLERKLDRVLDDAEGLLEEMDESESESGGLSTVERRTITICNRLDDQFTDDELRQEISDVAGGSQPTIDRYRELVVERLGVEPHPDAPTTVWVPEAVARDYAPAGTPRECRQPVTLLDREDRVRRIKLALGRRAAKRSTGRVTARTPTLREDILDDKVSRPSVLDLMESVALYDGFQIDRSGESAALRVNLYEIGDADPELFEEIIDYRDAETESLLGETTETTVTEFTNGPSSAGGSSAGSAQGAVTDGGGPSRRDNGGGQA